MASEKVGLPVEVSVKEFAVVSRRLQGSFEAPDKHLLERYYKSNPPGCLIMRKSWFFPDLLLFLG